MAGYLKPDRIRTERIGTTTLTIKEKIIPNNAVANKDVAEHVKKGQKMKPCSKLNRGSGIPSGITIHNTPDIKTNAATNPAEQYTRATWPNCNMGGVVVHLYVYKNEIWQNLAENERGWHAADGSSRRTDHRGGKTGGNLDTIAIECISASAESEATTQALTAYLCNKYKLDPSLDVYTHNYWSGKNCPMYILPHWPSFLAGVKKHLAQPVAPPPAPVKPTPSAPATVYIVKTELNGYVTADNAKKRISPKVRVKVGQYYVFKEYAGMINVTRVSGSPGSWINPSDNVTVTRPPVAPKPPAISVGSVVKIKQGARTYKGGKLLSFVYARKHKVKELSGNRAVVTFGGITVAAVNVRDLTLV